MKIAPISNVNAKIGTVAKKATTKVNTNTANPNVVWSKNTFHYPFENSAPMQFIRRTVYNIQQKLGLGKNIDELKRLSDEAYKNTQEIYAKINKMAAEAMAAGKIS